MKAQFATITLFAAFAVHAAETVWLDSLDLSSMKQGWGTPQINRSIREQPLSVGGQKFERGVGTHANSTYRLTLNGGTERFTSSVRHSADVARAVRAELSLIGPETPVVVLQGRHPPGLAFYLRRPILTTRMRRSDDRFGPDLSRGDLPAWLAARGGRAVAVGEASAFRKLPAEVHVSPPLRPAASRYLVATISDR